MITLGNDSLLSSLESNQFIICRVSLSMFLCIFDVYDKAYSLLIADEKSMGSLTGILLDVSCSMAGSIGEGTDEEGGPWARSIFEVIDNLIKYDISSDHHVFAIGFGASCGEEVFDIIGTLKGIPNQDNVAERPATTEHINEIFDILEKAGARTIRKWAEDEVVSKALADNLAVVFLKKFESDKSFLEEFVEKILPPACRDWPEPGLGVQIGAACAAAVICPPAAIPTFLALKYGPKMGKDAYSSAVTQYRRATVNDVKEVVEKAKAHLLKKVDVNSIFNVKHASDVVHGCVGEEKLTKKKSLELLERIEPYIYGRTPFLRAIGEAMILFQDSRFSSHKKLLFILSDGDPTDENISSGTDRVISKFTEAGVTIVSCFITDSTHIDPKRLFSKEEPDWDQFAKFMFSLSSKLSTQSLPRTMFVKRDWTMDFTNNETHLFLQVNHPDHLREGCEVARNVVCCQDALSDMLASVNVDVYINQEVKDYKAKRVQEGETCYAEAAATVLHLSMTRIRGREGGCPDFYTLKDEIVKEFDPDNYPDGVPTIRVLEKMCPKYRLRCKRVNHKEAMQAVASSRPVVAIFRLTENEWDSFDDFYEENPKGILTKKEIDITARSPKNQKKISGHAAVLTSFDSECLRLLNSWGEHWGDMGFFRVQKANVLGLEFIDVYWTEDDLKEEEITYFKKFGSINAGILMELLPSLKGAEYTCPKCGKRSPVMEFTGTLSRAKCPKCEKEISTENAQEGNILALNIYLTSLIR